MVAHFDAGGDAAAVGCLAFVLSLGPTPFARWSVEVFGHSVRFVAAGGHVGAGDGQAPGVGLAL